MFVLPATGGAADTSLFRLGLFPLGVLGLAGGLEDVDKTFDSVGGDLLSSLLGDFEGLSFKDSGLTRLTSAVLGPEVPA